MLYYLLAETHYQCGDSYFYYFHLSNLVVSSNSALNFVVYCVCRRNFRRRLVALCGRDGTTRDGTARDGTADAAPVHDCTHCRISPARRFH